MSIYTFFVTSFIIILLPGTGVLYTISTGITKNKNAALLAAFGCTAGIIPHLCFSIAVSSYLVKMSSQTFTIMKLLGSGYLLYLGTGLIFSKIELEMKNMKALDRNILIVRRGILINLLNPKLTLFFLSFLPQYVSSHGENYIIESLLYGLAFMLITLIVFIAYALLAGSAKSLIIHSRPKMNVLQKFFGITFVIFAIQLALSSL